MKRQCSWLLAAAAIVAVLTAGVPHAVAGPPRRPAQMSDGQFFAGHGAAFHGPFSLLGGRYYVDVWAQDNAIYDPNDIGCVFGAYIDGIETPLHLTLSAPLRVRSFPAGHYKLSVLPGTDCDWRVSILPLGPAAPAIDVVAVRSFLHRGNTFTPTTVAHMGQTIDFAIFFTLQGAVSGTPAGTLSISEHGTNGGSFRLRPWKDTDGTRQLYANIMFTRKSGDTPGPATATFNIIAGTLRSRQTLGLTLAN
jgi:hypothetical protein